MLHPYKHTTEYISKKACQQAHGLLKQVDRSLGAQDNLVLSTGLIT